jgi:hypothetical protein
MTRLTDAMAYAAELHAGQLRKGTEIPTPGAPGVSARVTRLPSASSSTGRIGLAVGAAAAVSSDS